MLVYYVYATVYQYSYSQVSLVIVINICSNERLTFNLALDSPALTTTGIEPRSHTQR